MEDELVNDEMIKVTLTDPIAQANKLFPRPAQIKLGRRQAKELRQEFKRLKKGAIKNAKKQTKAIRLSNLFVKARQGMPLTLHSLFPIKPVKLTPEEMKQLKERAIFIIERKVNGNTDKI